jgi:hypothetical protein
VVNGINILLHDKEIQEIYSINGYNHFENPKCCVLLPKDSKVRDNKDQRRDIC